MSAALCRRALFLTTLLCACGPREAPPPMVVLVSLDTVRADRWASVATPAFDRLAARADRYADCVASAPWTLPTHASMFTGLAPSEHGAVSFEVDALEDNAYPLHASHVTLAEALSSAGYATAGFVANTVYLSPRHGLDQGFETWQVRRQPGERVSRAVLTWLDARKDSRAPLFLFVNYMDAHRPYNARPARDGRQSVALLDELLERVMARGERDDEALQPLRADLLACYDDALANLDAALGLLFDGLEARGLLDDSLVIVTSDHGEAFGEHGLVEHSKDVWQTLLAVPLIVKRPHAQAGRDVVARASSVDIPGLVAEVTGVDAARFPRRPGNHPVVAENRFSRPHDLVRFPDRFRGVRRATFEGSLKLIVDSRGPAAPYAPQLFDLACDPAEAHDLALARTDEVLRLTAALRFELDRAPWTGPFTKPGALDDAARQELRALGYGGE